MGHLFLFIYFSIYFAIDAFIQWDIETAIFDKYVTLQRGINFRRLHFNFQLIWRHFLWVLMFIYLLQRPLLTKKLLIMTSKLLQLCVQKFDFVSFGHVWGVQLFILDLKLFIAFVQVHIVCHEFLNLGIK